MKHFFLLITFCVWTIHAFAQSEDAELTSIQKAYEACISMRDAVGANDKEAIRSAASNLGACDTKEFNSLRSKSDEESINGHLLFDEVFASALANGEDIYQQADSIGRSRLERGQTADGSILTKTCFAKAGKTVKYTFPSKGRQELAVVAEAGGRVTMKVHVTNKKGLNKRYDDTTSVKMGLPNRKTTFMLPGDCVNIVELEVINCCMKDISFVVISN